MSQTFENLMNELEKIVSSLESNELSLEKAIEAYQRGVTLAKLGHDRLIDAERKIEEVTRGQERQAIDPAQILGSSE
jgi:exodeoxyribonuclease VII small subunit